MISIWRIFIIFFNVENEITVAEWMKGRKKLHQKAVRFRCDVGEGHLVTEGRQMLILRFWSIDCDSTLYKI